MIESPKACLSKNATETGSFHEIVMKPKVPPIKCQGIKTKLVPFILSNIKPNPNGRWIEPFLGSGVVLFNAAPKRAIASDINPHIINFYQEIIEEKITPKIVRKFLEKNGEKLRTIKDFYYEMRDRFNETGDPLIFLFLNRCCFNGMIRFNSKGKYNVPFGHKPNRFRKAYVTKIVNQVKWVQELLKNKEIIFKCRDWKETLEKAQEEDFVYLDPPYFGRHVDYYNSWTEKNALDLVEWTKTTTSGFALSMWKQNKYRKNTFIDENWNEFEIKTNSHFYFVGPTEDLRNKMEEALIIKPGRLTYEE